MTKQTTLEAGLAAHQTPAAAPIPDLALVLHSAEDTNGAIIAGEAATKKYADLMQTIMDDTAKEEDSLRESLSRALPDDQVKPALDAAIVKFQREKIAALQDKFREQVTAVKQWGERAEVSLKVMSSPAALLVSEHGFDSSPEFANLVERVKALGFTGFQSAAAQCLNQRDKKLGAAIVEVLQNRTKREMAEAAGVSVNSIADHLVGEQYRARRATLLRILDTSKLLEESWAAQSAFMAGRAASPNLSPRARIERGMRLKEVEKLTKTTAKAS